MHRDFLNRSESNAKWLEINHGVLLDTQIGQECDWSETEMKWINWIPKQFRRISGTDFPEQWKIKIPVP